MKHVLICSILSMLSVIIVTGEDQAVNTSAHSISVADFGAKGDGKTDDAAAFQKAIDAACMIAPSGANNPGRKVVIPAGMYRIARTINLTPLHWNLVLDGTGGANGGSKPSYKGQRRANTVLLWDGETDGNLISAYGTLGLQMRDLLLDGQNKCGVLLRMNSLDETNADQTMRKTYGTRAAALWTIDRVMFENARTGFECGGDSWICASDMTLVDVNFFKCQTGFVTLMDQNLNYCFIRPGVAECDIGLHFKRGGNVTANMLTGYACGTVIRIEKGGINGGTYNFIGTRVEARTFKGRRTAILYAQGESVVNMTSLVTTCMGLGKVTAQNSVEFGKDAAVDAPNFTIREGAMVKIDSSLISGPIADLQGRCWLQMDNCTFRYLADPRKDIRSDKDAGFEVRNSFLTVDKLEDNKYIQEKNTFISRLTRPAANIPAISE